MSDKKQYASESTGSKLQTEITGTAITGSKFGQDVTATPFDQEMNASQHITHFGAAKVGEFTPIVSANFPGSSLNTEIWTETDVGSAQVIVGSGAGNLSTGTDSNGSTKLISVTRGEFFAGVVTVYQSGVAAGVGVANNIRRWGLMSSDEQDGLFFELNGTSFRVVARKAGVDTAVEQSSFSGDQTFTPNTNNNTYRIHYSAGRALFQRASAGKIVTLHTMVRSDLPLVDDLDLNLYYENTNTGNTTNVSMIVRGASSGIIGRPTGAAGSAVYTLRTRKEGEVFRGIRRETITTAYPVEYTLKGAIVLTEKTDVKVRCEDVSDNNTAFSVAFEYVLVDN